MAATEATASPLLSMRAISKAFGGIPALSAATLDVAAGEVHALIGQNGAGKSTMIKILTGYVARDAGEIVFDGGAFEASSPQDAQAKGISTIYQEINLVPYRSITENICLGRESRRFGLLDWAAMHNEARALLSRFQDRCRRSPAADAIQHRDAADGGDRARDRLQGQARHHGRTHFVAGRTRSQRAVRRHPATEDDPASR